MPSSAFCVLLGSLGVNFIFSDFKTPIETVQMQALAKIDPLDVITFTPEPE